MAIGTARLVSASPNETKPTMSEVAIALYLAVMEARMEAGQGNDTFVRGNTLADCGKAHWDTFSWSCGDLGGFEDWTLWRRRLKRSLKEGKTSTRRNFTEEKRGPRNEGFFKLVDGFEPHVLFVSRSTLSARQARCRKRSAQDGIGPSSSLKVPRLGTNASRPSACERRDLQTEEKLPHKRPISPPAPRANGSATRNGSVAPKIGAVRQSFRLRKIEGRRVLTAKEDIINLLSDDDDDADDGDDDDADDGDDTGVNGSDDRDDEDNSPLASMKLSLSPPPPKSTGAESTPAPAQVPRVANPAIARPRSQPGQASLQQATEPASTSGDVQMPADVPNENGLLSHGVASVPPVTGPGLREQVALPSQASLRQETEPANSDGQIAVKMPSGREFKCLPDQLEATLLTFRNLYPEI